jgi:prophage regulatory protein
VSFQDHLPPHVREKVERERKALRPLPPSPHVHAPQHHGDRGCEAADGSDDNSRAHRKPDKLLFPREVQEIVRLSEPTIWRLRRAGKFPAPLRLGERRIAWRESEIEAWLVSRPHAA